MPRHARTAISNARGFTLIELAVVLAVLSAVVLGASRAAKHTDHVSDQVVCESNLRVLTFAYLSFPMDQRGRLVYGAPDDLHLDAYVEAGPGYQPIRSGAMHPYVKDVAAWRCKADPNEHGNKRNYAIVAPMRGERFDRDDVNEDPWAQAGTGKLSDVVNLARQLVFVEEWDSAGWNSGSWMMKVGRKHDYQWIDYVSNFHGRAANYAFADGHVERYVMKDIDTITAADTGTRYLVDEGNVDWEWLRTRYRQMKATEQIALWQ